MEPKNELLTKLYNAAALDFDAVFKEYSAYAERLSPYIKDTTSMISDLLEQRQQYSP